MEWNGILAGAFNRNFSKDLIDLLFVRVNSTNFQDATTLKLKKECMNALYTVCVPKCLKEL